MSGYLQAEAERQEDAAADAEAEREHLNWLEERHDEMLEALADAVRAPKGVIPDSCLPYLAEIQKRTHLS